MNTPTSQDKLRKLSIQQKRIIRELLTDERALLSHIEKSQEELRKQGISEEEIKEHIGMSHKCCWHKICTYIHILNGNRGKAIKTFYKWRDNSNDILWMLMEKHKTSEGKACKIEGMYTDKDNIIQTDLKDVDDGGILEYATDMKHNDKIFCNILKV